MNFPMGIFSAFISPWKSKLSVLIYSFQAATAVDAACEADTGMRPVIPS